MTTEYSKRNTRPPEPTSEHHPFFLELQRGGRVWRNDKLNDVREWLTLDHPGIQGNPANVCYFGYRDLSSPNDGG